MKKKKKEPALGDLIRAGLRAGLLQPRPGQSSWDKALKPLEVRINVMKEAISKHYESGERPYFVMYDIEDNRIRRHIAKFLKKRGFIRVQKSVYLGWIYTDMHKELCSTLKEVNEFYENMDSIIILPAMEDILQKTLIIGKRVEFQLETKHTHTIIV